MEDLKPGGLILRADLTLVAFVGPNAVEIRLSPQEAMNLAEALVGTALQNATPDLIASGTQFSLAAGAA